MAADGYIIIQTDIDNKKAQTELNRLTSKIDKMREILSKDEGEKSGIEAELNAAKDEALKTEQTIKRLKTELAETQKITIGEVDARPTVFMDAKNRQAEILAQLKEQETLLAQQDKETQRLDAKYAKITDKVIQTTNELKDAETHAGALSAQLTQAGTAGNVMASAADQAGKYMDKFINRVKGLARRVFVFTLITSALRAMRTWLWKVIQTDSEATASVAKLKGALLTLAQPLVNVIIPAFITLVNVLARVVSAIASLISMLFGSTIEQSSEAAESLYQETEALEGVGSAAKDAGKSMASFDEINQLSGGAKSGGGGSGSSTITPDFNLDAEEGILNDILRLVGAIGAGLLAWKIASGFTNSLQTLAGVALIVGGALEFVFNWLDAWNNGVDWGNLNGMVLGLAAAAVGLYMVLGPVAAGIALIVGGLLILATGIKDVIENGWTMENLFTIIAGLFAAGIGISILTGSFIPALVAGILGILLAITVLTGHGGELIDGLKEMFSGFTDFFKGVFTGDFELAAQGIEKIFNGLGTVFNAVLDGIKDAFIGLLNWLDEKTGGKLHGILETIKGMFTGLVDGIKQILGGIIEFLTGVFTGDWDRAWNGVKDIFKGVWNGVVSLLEGAVNLIIKGVNWLISQLNKIHFELPDWIPGIGGKSFGINIPLVSEIQIPRLAQGAVIPPNREFMAVLGDQKSGTNIEAPEALIRRIVKEEAGNNGGSMTLVLDGDLAALATVFRPYLLKEDKRIGVKLTTR